MSRKGNIQFITIALLIMGAIYSYYGTFTKLSTIKTYSTEDINGTYPFRSTIETKDGETIRTIGGGSKFWFNKDQGYEHFEFEVVVMQNIYGAEVLITEY